MKQRTEGDQEIRSKIAKALKRALKQRKISPEKAAELLQVELGTLYKYLSAAMIPGGHVLWRACRELGMVLDSEGLRVTSRGARRATKATAGTDQYELPFVNESVAGDKVHLTITKKDGQSAEYVSVNLRIKVAG